MIRVLRILRWMVWNSIFPAFLILGGHYEIEGFGHSAVFLANLSLFASFMMLVAAALLRHDRTSENIKTAQKILAQCSVVPDSANVWFDFACSLYAAYLGWTYTASVYLLHTILCLCAKADLEHAAKPEEPSPEESSD